MSDLALRFNAIRRPATHRVCWYLLAALFAAVAMLWTTPTH